MPRTPSTMNRRSTRLPFPVASSRSERTIGLEGLSIKTLPVYQNRAAFAARFARYQSRLDGAGLSLFRLSIGVHLINVCGLTFCWECRDLGHLLGGCDGLRGGILNQCGGVRVAARRLYEASECSAITYRNVRQHFAVQRHARFRKPIDKAAVR